MGKSRYTKEDLELRCERQLAYLDALGRRVQLLERQNELLVKYNNKLCDLISDRKPPIPYVIKRTTSKRKIENLAADMQANFPELD